MGVCIYIWREDINRYIHIYIYVYIYILRKKHHAMNHESLELN
jgi:hypothetical protein